MFLGMLMYANWFKTKEKRKLTEIRINCNLNVVFVIQMGQPLKKKPTVSRANKPVVGTLIVNLRNRTGEERRAQTSCASVTILFEKNLPPNLTFLETDLFEEQKPSMLSEFPTKHSSNSPFTFVTLKRFAVVSFLPSCCVNSLLT